MCFAVTCEARAKLLIFSPQGKKILQRFMLVGAARFELTTSCSQSRRSTRLSYAPNGAATLIETSQDGKTIFTHREK
jgi:hypothetical protein